MSGHNSIVSSPELKAQVKGISMAMVHHPLSSVQTFKEVIWPILIKFQGKHHQAGETVVLGFWAALTGTLAIMSTYSSHNRLIKGKKLEKPSLKS